METIGIDSNFFRHQVFPKSGVKDDETVNTEYHHPQSPYAIKIYGHPSIVQISSATKCANPSGYLTLLVKTNSLVEKVETPVVHTLHTGIGTIRLQVGERSNLQSKGKAGKEFKI